MNQIPSFFSSSAVARAGLLGLALMGASSGAAGCKKAAPPWRPSYMITFPGGAPVGGEVMVGDQKIGTIGAPTQLFKDREVIGKPGTTVTTEQPLAIVGFEPEIWLSDSAASLTVALRSACATQKVPLKLRGLTRSSEEDLREKQTQWVTPPRVIVIEADVQMPAKRPTHVWTDRTTAPKAVISVGKAELNPGELAETWLFGLDCQARHEVKIDGKTVGTLEIDPVKGPPKGLVISAGKDQCYSLNEAIYGYKGVPSSSSAPRSWSYKAPIAALDVDDIDYFIREAPGTKRNPSKLRFIEFVAAPCGGEGAAPKGKTKR